jgi:hypothetical protein
MHQKWIRCYEQPESKLNKVFVCFIHLNSFLCLFYNVVFSEKINRFVAILFLGVCLTVRLSVNKFALRTTFCKLQPVHGLLWNLTKYRIIYWKENSLKFLTIQWTKNRIFKRNFLHHYLDKVVKSFFYIFLLLDLLILFIGWTCFNSVI